MSTMQSSSDKDLQVQWETKDTPESHLLLVHIPDGFAKEHIGAKVEYDFGRVRVYGERPLGKNRSSRFDERYKVPSHCDINRITGKFEGKIITIIMPKIPGRVPEEPPKPAEQEPPKPAVQETEPDQKNDKEETPPQSATGDDKEKEKATASEVKDQKGTQEPIASEVRDQKGTQEATSEVKDQKDPKSTEEGKEEASDHEASTSTPAPEATEESLPQKGIQEEATPQNATATRDAKLQTEEKSSDEKNKEKEKVGKEETEDIPNKNTAESGNKPVEKAVVADSSSPAPEKESKEESKESSMVESVLPKSTEKVKGKEIDGKSGDDGAEAKSDKKAMVESTRTKIKEKASSAYQTLTSLVNRFNDEDKQKLIYMGAAVVVVTLGVYASYKFRSSRRP